MGTAWNESRSGVVMGGAILVVEDEPAIQELIAVNLEHAGHQVLRAANVAEAEALVREVLPDLVLLDWMLPGPPGVNFARQLRADQRTKDIPIIMLTARAQEQDTIAGLESGADDYVTKPFSPRELLARVRAVVRRGRGDGGERKTHVRVGDLEIDRHRFEVRLKGRVVELTPKEFELLAILASAPGRVFGREELLDAVWGRDGFVEPRTVDVHVARLRAKFTDAKLPPPGIETVRGVGYRYRDAVRP